MTAHSRSAMPTPRQRWSADAGFSMPEVVVATMLTIMISGAATQALMHMTRAQKSIWNRAEMHAGVRGATELLQQEIGQAGRVSLPGTVTTTAAATAGATTISVSSTDGMFVGEKLMLGAGNTSENVVISAIAGTTLTVDSAATGAGTGIGNAHASGVPVTAVGGFSAGIIPPSFGSGSTATTLKLFGDINSDGRMLYVEYTCDTARGKLLRRVMPWNASVKTPLASAGVLLGNILPNPGGAACFRYQEQIVGSRIFVTGVSVMLTVQTLQRDPTTNQFQVETKNLLSVSPRNVFETWELASQNVVDRVQSIPPSITALLP